MAWGRTASEGSTMVCLCGCRMGGLIELVRDNTQQQHTGGNWRVPADRTDGRICEIPQRSERGSERRTKQSLCQAGKLCPVFEINFFQDS